jgi:uncharacterized membrane protein YkoI
MKGRIMKLCAPLAVMGLAVMGLAFAGLLSPTALADDDVVVHGTIAATKAQRAQWAGMAKITPEQAKAAALAAVKGTVDDVDLELEDGWLVYTVEIDDEAGVEHEIYIDAGNGTVLAKAVDD